MVDDLVFVYMSCLLRLLKEKGVVMVLNNVRRLANVTIEKCIILIFFVLNEGRKFFRPIISDI